jgi:hypothetical protein
MARPGCLVSIHSSGAPHADSGRGRAERSRLRRTQTAPASISPAAALPARPWRRFCWVFAGEATGHRPTCSAAPQRTGSRFRCTARAPERRHARRSARSPSGSPGRAILPTLPAAAASEPPARRSAPTCDPASPRAATCGGRPRRSARSQAPGAQTSRPTSCSVQVIDALTCGAGEGDAGPRRDCARTGARP